MNGAVICAMTDKAELLVNTAVGTCFLVILHGSGIEVSSEELEEIRVSKERNAGSDLTFKIVFHGEKLDLYEDGSNCKRLWNI